MTWVHRNTKAYKLIRQYFKTDTQSQIWFIINNPELKGTKPIVYLKNKYLKRILENKIINFLKQV